MNLAQIPVLVLTPGHERLKKPVEESRFRISLDSGPMFKPAHVRVEGDDPLSLAILVDAEHTQPELLDQLPASAARVALVGTFQSHDRFSVYTLGCTLTRSAQDIPANGVAMRAAIASGLGEWRRVRTFKRKERPECAQPVGLWDAIAYVTEALGKLPGRRVLLVLSAGTDSGSRTPWKQALFDAQFHAVSVFGVMEPDELPGSPLATATSSTGRHAFGSWTGPQDHENAFDAICEETGGVEFGATPRTLDKSLTRFVQMLRERYIVEFPRPTAAGQGFHTIDVEIQKGFAYIRPGGITIPLPTAQELSDPTTLPHDPANDVPVGHRRVLGPD
jgi:VWFA-related protein